MIPWKYPKYDKICNSPKVYLEVYPKVHPEVYTAEVYPKYTQKYTHVRQEPLIATRYFVDSLRGRVRARQAPEKQKTL